MKRIRKAERCGRLMELFFFSSRRRHTRYWRDWSSDVCSSDLMALALSLSLGLLPSNAVPKHRHHAPVTAVADSVDTGVERSEERRVGKECRSRGSPYH